MKSTAAIRFRLRVRPGDVLPASNSGRLPKVTQALALAIHFEDTIRTGEAKDCKRAGNPY